MRNGQVDTDDLSRLHSTVMLKHDPFDIRFGKPSSTTRPERLVYISVGLHSPALILCTCYQPQSVQCSIYTYFNSRPSVSVSSVQYIYLLQLQALSLSQFSAVYILTSTPGPQSQSVQCSIYTYFNSRPSASVSSVQYIYFNSKPSPL